MGTCGKFQKSSIKVVGVPGEQKKIGPEENNRKSGQNFQNLLKDKNLQIKEVQWQNRTYTTVQAEKFTSRNNTFKKTTSRYIIV